MADYSLHLFSSVLTGAAPAGDLTRIASSYRRRIRLQGGAFEGSFQIIGEPLSVCQDIFYSYLGAHVVETAGDSKLEFLIWEMDIDDTPEKPFVDVTLAGYIRTANNRFVTAGDGSMDNVSDWISEIVSTDCEFLNAGVIKTNTLQVKKQTKIDQRAFDEMLQKTELGDASGNPWRIYVGDDREIYYEPISTVPDYFVHGGIRRRRSLDLLANRIGGTYVNTSDSVQTLGVVSSTPSMAEFGTFDERLALNDLDQAAAEARRDVYLAEYGFPWARAVGSGKTAGIFDAAGQIINPFRVRPGVFRDSLYPGGGAETDTLFLTDVRDFIVDEIEAGSDGNISLRTIYFDEADLLALQQDYYTELERQAERLKNES